MAILTEDMKSMVSRIRLCFVATVSPDGKPNLSPKGSIGVWDDEHLVFADIASPNTVENLKGNPYIEINVVDPILRRGYRFKGKAELVYEGSVFDKVAGELWGREGQQYPVNTVVKIHVEHALPVRSPAYTFNPGVTEEDVKAAWLKRYGYREVEPENSGLRRASS